MAAAKSAQLASPLAVMSNVPHSSELLLATRLVAASKMPSPMSSARPTDRNDLMPGSRAPFDQAGDDLPRLSGDYDPHLFKPSLWPSYWSRSGCHHH